MALQRQTYQVENKQECHWVRFISIIGEFFFSDVVFATNYVD